MTILLTCIDVWICVIASCLRQGFENQIEHVCKEAIFFILMKMVDGIASYSVT